MLIDIIFAALFIFACIKGWRKGLIVALFSIIAFIAGLAAALKLSAVVATKLAANVEVSGKWLPVISFVLVFLIVVFLVNLGAGIIQKTAEVAMLGWLNRIGGVVLFVLLYSIIYSIFLFYALQLHFIKPATIATSQLYQYIQPMGPKVINMLGGIIPIFKDTFAQLEHFFGEVSNKLQH
ncbi:MAG: CvpA family protein [Ferruginibacter sp.]|nr:CvpA family protein [Ferruginibacter sp.]